MFPISELKCNWHWSRWEVNSKMPTHAQISSSFQNLGRHDHENLRNLGESELQTRLPHCFKGRQNWIPAVGLFFICFRECRKRSSLEWWSYMHPRKWMKLAIHGWKFIYSFKTCSFIRNRVILSQDLLAVSNFIHWKRKNISPNIPYKKFCIVLLLAKICSLKKQILGPCSYAPYWAAIEAQLLN